MAVATEYGKEALLLQSTADAVQPQAMASSFGIDGPQWMASSLCYDGKTYFGGARSATAATCDDDDEKDDDAAATGDDDADKPPVTCLIGGAVRDGGMEVLAYGEESAPSSRQRCRLRP